MLRRRLGISDDIYMFYTNDVSNLKEPVLRYTFNPFHATDLLIPPENIRKPKVFNQFYQSSIET